MTKYSQQGSKMILECHFSKYSQMSGGRFLVSMRDVNNSEKMLALNSIIKEYIDFQEDNVYSDDTNIYMTVLCSLEIG